MDITNLQPNNVWKNFAALNSVPRPSKKEGKVIEFIRQFGVSLGLETTVDETGNVLIRKPATQGMEDHKTVVLQSHLDMVCQKNNESDFDFDSQGIKMLVDGDWVKADGTTLGADNGIGVASIMSVLESDSIPHPAIEALFTIDEETGMTGAKGLVGGLLNGTILLNLDTEDDDELTIGCAGGIDVTCTGEYLQEKPKGDLSLKISIKGLTGGHSGVDIQKGRANANKLMNRLLWELSKDFSIEIATIDGGSLRNAIPRESVAEIVLDKKKHNELKEAVTKFEKTIKAEHSFTDASLEVKLENTVAVRNVMNADFQYKFLRSMYACPNGIYRMTPEIEGLVQTSNNIAKVLVKEGKLSVQCLTRSSVDTEKTDLANAITSAFELIGASIEFGGNYPGWEPKPDAPIIKIMSELYEELFKGKAHVNAVHAGLECGIIGTNYPDMQMISFGPNIYGAHSPDERAQISSVQKFWIYLLATLKKIPVTE